ncbi:hypothetical protein DBA20_14690 [Pandoraea capi]|nr:hypothetical protein [Pandoraea sp. LA3]MDN4584235.1 hypothetical protein [Pandoraea capi]
MHDALAAFRSNMDDVEAFAAFYDFLVENMRGQKSLDDLLRSKIVCSVSAFDKLMHDIIHIGIIDIYSGNRTSTPKYLDEPIPLGVVAQLKGVEDAPRSNIFSQTIRDKLRAMSFQHPDKVVDGLSYIWHEKRKWKKIASAMGEDEATVRVFLYEVVRRRNAIAHEADVHHFLQAKRPINREMATDFTRFMRRLGETIHELVR